jgi:hypothetical protein
MVGLPAQCPGCASELVAKRLECAHCGTAVEGAFSLPLLARLTPAEQEFALNFLKCGGALKDLARVYGVSYPTVRNRLDALMARIGQLQASQSENAPS